MTKKYVLELTREQAETLTFALELFARIGMGQFDCLKQSILNFGDTLKKERRISLYQGINELERELCEGLTGDRAANLGISSSDVPMGNKRAYDTFLVLRHGLEMSKDSSYKSFEGIGIPSVGTDDPMLRKCVEDEDLPKLTII